jgi:hypothetical protein
VEGGGGMRMTSLEHELTQLCFEAERMAGDAKQKGEMERYLYLRGKYEAYKTAAQMTEKHFENPLNL